jgi:hypothetical protein
MPSSSLLPLQPPKNAYILIHEPIDTRQKTIKQVKQEVFDAVNAGLPVNQRYLSTSSNDAGNDATE